MTVATDTTAELVRALPHDIVTTDPDVILGYAADQSSFTQSDTPSAVVMPRSTAEVAACLRTAHALGIPVITRGAGSGLSGAANCPRGAIVLSTHRMNSISEVDRANRIVTVGPGAITNDVREHAAAAGLFYPPDPGSVAFCTIGGNVSTNAGGMCCVKYGVTGDFVLELECVLADGTVIRTGTATRKGVAGYDLTRLLVGSEGTLAIITEITLRLLPAPQPARTMLASFATVADAGRAVTAISTGGLVPSMLEILDRTTVRAVDSLTHMGIGDDIGALVLAQFDTHDADGDISAVEAFCAASGALDVVVASTKDEGDLLLEARRQALPALERLGDWLLDDVCVPCSRIAELIDEIGAIAEYTQLTIGVFGHAGDGNLHPTIIYDRSCPDSAAAAREAFDAITQLALDLGGTITGEHGVGRLKTGWLREELGEANLLVQQSIKRALDPTGILNPGAVIGDGHAPEVATPGA
ncbi:FAD-linked oxidase C-terminal domain-containing protein [Gordonia sp. i37]|uniref:FAD-binding oxidoreductase n=1 Tax=Gordonia sp. i37 TaxID=1961707 RepID=UPI0009AEE179|nr:FAD-linked oxidase C-terminal domain-containing protein [Gordonia sp. i37]OPX06393.1 FAD-binding oxidoreductase [Gordonia sp. i37]